MGPAVDACYLGSLTNKASLVVTLFAFLTACADSEAMHGQPVAGSCWPIVGGQPATDASPVVRLGGCSGVLIAPNAVLTAAHCQNAAFGEEVSRFIPHPDFSFPEHDIAIAQLAEPAVDLPVAPIGEARDGEALIAGYGDTEEGRTSQLHQATVQIEAIGETFIYVLPGPGSCTGDSGGGVFVDGVLVGILFGVTAGGCGSGSYATEVAQYSTWIGGIIDELSPDC